LNLGLGFNQNATVRENILLRATAMGQSLAEAAALSESILEFADLHEVANHRLLTLSSGQRMRLGFAISTSVQHDIMLMDEWFGAGDAYFVDKARSRLSDRVEGCKILVLASHNFEMIRKVCSLGMVLDEGRQVFLGPVEGSATHNRPGPGIRPRLRRRSP
jgi:lipopolysaccharide transport system ATP-binding protein